MPHIDHAAIWVADLDDARDFYSHWFNGHANGLYENPRTGLRTHILQFTDGPWEERRTRLELMSRPDITARAGAPEQRAGAPEQRARILLPARPRGRRPARGGHGRGGRADHRRAPRDW